MAVDITELLDKLPPLPIPGLHSTDSIGIDVGSNSVKIVQLKGTLGKYQLVRWSLIPLTGTGENEKVDLTPEEKKASAVSILKNYRGSGKGIPANAAASVSGSSVIVRYVKFQKLTRKELSKTIKAESEPYIPFNVEEVFIGFHPIKDVMEEGKQKMETVLVAAKKDIVNQKVEILESAGFKPVVMDVDAFALESVIEAASPPRTEEPGVAAEGQAFPENYLDETVLVANIGFSQTNFVIVEKGISKMVKDSPIAGNSMTKAVMKNLGTDVRAAEKLKVAGGILISAQEKEEAMNAGNKEAIGVSNALSSVVKDLTAEMKKLIEFYSVQSPESQVTRVLVSGGASNIGNLVPFLSKELNFSVEKLNPFARIAGAEGVPEQHRPTLAVAVGLAMRKPGDIKD